MTTADPYTSVRTFLLTDATVLAAVGSRIYPDYLPEGAAFPAIRLVLIASSAEPHMTNVSACSTMLMQIDVGSDTRLEANSIAETIRMLLSGYRGAMGSLDVRSCYVHRQDAVSLAPEDSSDEWLHINSMDCQISFVSEVPSR